MVFHRAALALLLVTAPTSLFAATITSDFTDGADGWRHGTYHSDVQADVLHDAAGYIAIDNGWYAGGFLAPEKFLGNQSSFLNGTLSFQLSTDRVPPAGTQFPALILVGNNGQAIFSNYAGLPGTSLTDFTINLTAESFYKGSVEGPVSNVSLDEFAAIMASLEKLSIFGDWNGGEIASLDNVVMQSTAAVPEPASWAMMIVGFGAVGMTMRRRPTQVRFA